MATTMMGVPTFYTRLLEEPGFTRDLVRWHTCGFSCPAPRRFWPKRIGSFENAPAIASSNATA
jgi:hypothetical protein